MLKYVYLFTCCSDTDTNKSLIKMQACAKHQAVDISNSGCPFHNILKEVTPVCGFRVTIATTVITSVLCGIDIIIFIHYILI